MGVPQKCTRRILFMRKREIITTALVTVLLITAQVNPALAAENVAASTQMPNLTDQAAILRLKSTSTVLPTISISGKKVSASVLIVPTKQTTTSKGKLYLEKKSGSSWSPVASWPIDATGTVSLTKTYTGTKGVTYRTRVVVTTGADKIDAASTARTV